jgi:hypothetical protein
MPVTCIARGALFAALTLVVVASVRKPEQRIVAILLGAGLVQRIAAAWLREHVGPAVELAGGAPLSGLELAEAHLLAALTLAWSAAVASVALRMFTGLTSRWTIGAPAFVWALLVAFVVATYPETRDLHREVYLVGKLAGTATGVAAIWWWTVTRAGEMTRARLCVALIVALEGATLLWFRQADIYTTYGVAQAAYAIMFFAVALVQAEGLCRTS